YIEFGLSIAENSGGGTFFNGAMDEVKIWSVALTADEVQESMRVALAAVQRESSPPNGLK
ncbi:MAG: LamG-like jellyroll fold domain-containing protein, partial [Candidatus Poribacteria bacterium]